jgi:hypothetical protein
VQIILWLLLFVGALLYWFWHRGNKSKTGT